MHSSFTPSLLPSLHSIAMIDWLPKLGEKAFLAWLRLHSWKKESSSAPFCIPLSLNRVIKRLRVGNTTFYEHILRPLWNYGFIDVKITANKKRELILYSFPLNNPDKSSDPLIPMRDYDLEFSPTASSAPSEPTVEFPVEPSFLETRTPPPSDLDSLPTSSCIQEETPPYQASSEDLHTLPETIQEAILTDPALQERSKSIVHVYHQCKDDPHHTDKVFLRKVRSCIPYCHDIRNFASYLYKAILNEWSHPSPPPRPAKKNAATSQRPPDVPEWVWQQQQGTTPPIKEISQEDREYAQKLLRELGEIQ